MNKSKTFMIVSISLLIVTIIASGITYAWYTWSTTSENETKIVTSMGAAKVFFDGGASITGVKLKPTSSKEEGIVKDITVKTSKDTAYKISFNLYLDVISLDNGLKDASFKYALYKEGQADAVATGNFLNPPAVECTTNSTNHIVLVNDEAITTTTQEYKLYIWIDGNMSNPNTMQSQNFNFKLHADGQNAVLGETLVEHINNLYNNAAKSPVENGDEGSKISYNYASSVSLMNDRLGTMSVGANDGNIRYYGASPNNYIDIGDVYEKDTPVNNWEKYGAPSQEICYSTFDCSVAYEDLGFPDEETCEVNLQTILKQAFGVSTADEVCGSTIIPAGTPKSLYRIIGLFKDVELSDGTKKDLVKVVRDESIGNYSWDQSPEDVNNGEGVNEWSQADLMKLLNPDYDGEIVGGSLYWNSGSGTCYGYDEENRINSPISCDFTYSGLSASVRGKIETVKWNLGAWNHAGYYSNQIYEYERGENVIQNPSDGIKRTSVWSGKVALAYPSDYGYSVDLTSCSKALYRYSDATCNSTNWMFNVMTNNGMYYSWLLTSDSSHEALSWSVDISGTVNFNREVSGDNYTSYHNGGISPVFYIDSSLGIVSGDGSIDTPFVVR